VGGKQTARGCTGCMMTGVVVDGYLCHTHETRPAKMRSALRVQQRIVGVLGVP
jgi:hypothetical protein